MDYLDPTLVAVPVFLLAIAWEVRALSRLRERGADVVGYEKHDTWVSIGMGLGSVVTVGVLNLGIYALADLLWPYRLTDLGTGVAGWAVAIVGWDLGYYWVHRWEHEIRLFWAAHVNHHNSNRFNYSTALRQPWFPLLNLAVFPLLALVGVRPWMIMVSGGLNLVYQFWVHTEAVDRLPEPVEWVLNTPSHHRVHHGTNPEYIDRNYGGILIVWDRLFGSFEAERARVRYGITDDFEARSVRDAVFHEYGALARDVARARGMRTRLGFLVHGPKWSPARSAG